MEENNIQQQIDQINSKLDVLLDYVNQQRLKTESIEDLISDVSIIGKDAFNQTVEELDHLSVEIDPESVKRLVVRLVKNVDNFNLLLESLESMIDLSKDLAPIGNSLILDLTRKIQELEENGLFDLLNELSNPKILEGVNKLVTSFNSIEIEKVKPIGLFSMIKELNKPEMKKTLGFIIELNKNINK